MHSADDRNEGPREEHGDAVDKDREWTGNE